MSDSFVGNMSDWITMLGICIGVAAWWFAREDANRKSDELERYKVESRERTAKLENEAAQARLELARIDPINLPIRSIRADVYFFIRGEFFDWHFDGPIGGKSMASLSLSSEDGALVILRCSSFESMPSISSNKEGAEPDGRMFALTFEWPTPDFFNSQEDIKYWVERENASLAALEAKMKAAVISLMPTKEHVDISHSSCIVTFNGNIRRKFEVPSTSDSMSIVCLPKK